MGVMTCPGTGNIIVTPKNHGFVTLSQQKTTENLMIPYTLISQLFIIVDSKD